MLKNNPWKILLFGLVVSMSNVTDVQTAGDDNVLSGTAKNKSSATLQSRTVASPRPVTNRKDKGSTASATSRAKPTLIRGQSTQAATSARSTKNTPRAPATTISAASQGKPTSLVRKQPTHTASVSSHGRSRQPRKPVILQSRPATAQPGRHKRAANKPSAAPTKVPAEKPSTPQETAKSNNIAKVLEQLSAGKLTPQQYIQEMKKARGAPSDHRGMSDTTEIESPETSGSARLAEAVINPPGGLSNAPGIEPTKPSGSRRLAGAVIHPPVTMAEMGLSCGYPTGLDVVDETFRVRGARRGSCPGPLVVDLPPKKPPGPDDWVFDPHFKSDVRVEKLSWPSWQGRSKEQIDLELQLATERCDQRILQQQLQEAERARARQEERILQDQLQEAERARARQEERERAQELERQKQEKTRQEFINLWTDSLRPLGSSVARDQALKMVSDIPADFFRFAEPTFVIHIQKLQVALEEEDMRLVWRLRDSPQEQRIVAEFLKTRPKPEQERFAQCLKALPEKEQERFIPALRDLLSMNKTDKGDHKSGENS